MEPFLSSTLGALVVCLLISESLGFTLLQGLKLFSTTISGLRKFIYTRCKLRFSQSLLIPAVGGLRKANTEKCIIITIIIIVIIIKTHYCLFLNLHFCAMVLCTVKKMLFATLEVTEHSSMKLLDKSKKHL